MESFKGFIGYTEDEFEELWKRATFVVDTNILINFYKYTSKESTKSLLDILKKLKNTNRLWIPHQVALEYFFNYENNMFKQNEGYDLLGKKLIKLKEDAETTLSSVKSQHPYIMTDNFQFVIKSMEESNQEIQEQLDEEILNLPDSKKTQEDLLDLLDEIIGEPYSQKEIDEIEKNGEERYLYNIPPGFEDKDKENKKEYRTYGNFSYQRQFGDLIVWHQIMDRAKKKDEPTPIIFITEDRKEDWWEINKGKVKRPQPQLIQEFINKTQQDFYMYRADSFVQYAVKYLDVELSDQQAKDFALEIEHIRKSGEKNYSKELIDQKRYANNFNKSLMNDFNIEMLMKYLSKNEQEHLKKMIGQSFNNEDIEYSNTQYNKAINWAIRKAYSKLQYKFNELIKILALKKYDKVQFYLSEVNLIPNSDEILKGKILLKYIEKIEKDLTHIKLMDSMGDLPF